MNDDPLLANAILVIVLAVAFYYYIRGSIEGR
jgi:hypothetical protein